MERKMSDCRDWPGPCELAISGREDEVIDAQLLHVVTAHGLEDSPGLREQIRASLKEAPAEV